MAFGVQKWWYRLILLVWVFLAFQASPVVADPDTFYHAAVVREIAQHGIMWSLPALPLTILGQHYVDHHYLYHVASVPFLWIGNAVSGTDALWRVLMPLIALKAAAAVYSAFFVLSFWYVLERWRVARAQWFVLILLASGGFLFRLDLVKAQALALAVLMIGIGLLFDGWPDGSFTKPNKKRTTALFLLSWIYVWMYGGWIVWVGIVLFFTGIVWILGKLGILSGFYWSDIYRKFRWVLAGSMVGMLINPYFPYDIWFIWYQGIQIGLLHALPNIPVGQEWYAPDPFGVVSDLAPIIIAMLVVGFFFLVLSKLPRQKLLLLFVPLSAFFIVLSGQSRRHYEYAAPFLVLTLALLYRELPPFSWAWLKRKQWVPIIIVMLVVPTVHVSQVWLIFQTQQRTVTLFTGSAQWLMRHEPPGAMITIGGWDEFPTYWYWAPQFKYPGGLDPRFSWWQSSEQYERWQRIVKGESSDPAGDVKRLGSHVVVLSVFHYKTAREQLDRSKDFIKTYEDAETSVYVLR